LISAEECAARQDVDVTELFTVSIPSWERHQD
jgi:hypothetical protein